MDWMKILVIIMAIVLIVMLIVMTAVGIALYRATQKTKNMMEHLEFSAANLEKATSSVVNIAGSGMLVKLISRGINSVVGSKNGKK